MDTFEIVIWEDELSDGTLAYASWCTAVIGVSGQGETEAEALADIAASISLEIYEPWPDDTPVFYDADVAAAKLTRLLADLDAEGITHWMRYLTMDDLRAAYAEIHAEGNVECPAANRAAEPAKAPAAGTAA